jgi:hypothetical protein
VRHSAGAILAAGSSVGELFAWKLHGSCVLKPAFSGTLVRNWLLPGIPQTQVLKICTKIVGINVDDSICFVFLTWACRGLWQVSNGAVTALSFSLDGSMLCVGSGGKYELFERKQVLQPISKRYYVALPLLK